MVAAVDTLGREGLLKDIFGEISTLCEQTPLTESVTRQTIYGSTSLSESLLFDIIVLLLIVLYLVWIIRYATHHQRGDYTEERWLYGDEDYRGEWSMAIRWSDVAYSVALLSVFAVTILSLAADWVVGHYSIMYDSLEGSALLDISAHLQQIGLVPIAINSTIYIFATTVWLGMIFFICSLFSQSEQLYSKIIRLRMQVLYLILLYFIPVFILFALNRDSVILWYIVVAEAVVFSVLYLVRGFLLFITQKISILQWFLYLCTVEIIPVVVAWVIFVRRVSII